MLSVDSVAEQVMAELGGLKLSGPATADEPGQDSDTINMEAVDQLNVQAGGVPLPAGAHAAAPGSRLHVHDNRKPSALSDPQVVARFAAPERLGSGGQGTVYMAYDTLHKKKVAIKFVKPSYDVRKDRYLLSEVINHRKLRHELVIGFREVFVACGEIGVVMDVANAGSLRRYAANRPGGRFGETGARFLYQQLIIGLDHCHQQGVVNRDIKMENTLVWEYPPGADGKQPLPGLRISDFGYSKEIALTPRSKVGTPVYMAPEVIRNHHRAPYDGKKADIWSSGVMLYWLLFGHHPWQMTEEEKKKLVERKRQITEEEYKRLVEKKILSIPPQWSVPSDIPVSPECKDLLQRILVSDPQQRPSIQQIYQHPWFAYDLAEEFRAMIKGDLGEVGDEPRQTEQQIRDLLQEAMPWLNEART